MKYLKISFTKKDGRNKEGRITSYHKGGGHSKKYRIVDWSHMIKGVFAYVLKKEYDPFRNVYIYLVYYQNGCFSYHLGIQGVLEGMYLYSGKDAPLWLGNNLPLYRYPAGSFVSNVNSLYGKAAGVRCQILKHFGKNSLVKLPSGERRVFPSEVWSTYGRIGKVYSKFEKKSKAGNNRNKGIRPCVRGVAMNPIDHPHGGGEGKTSGGRLSVTPWGKLTKGKKTKKK
mgnify:CR=1 FL=1